MSTGEVQNEPDLERILSSGLQCPFLSCGFLVKSSENEALLVIMFQLSREFCFALGFVLYSQFRTPIYFMLFIHGWG